MRPTDPFGRFCWVDLAATDAESATAFYGQLFGWTPQESRVNGGRFTRLRLGGADVGSLYQLRQLHLDHGVPSHWTPYVQVADADEAARRALALGGQLIVPPVAMNGIARVALVVDSVGAHFGLWQGIGSEASESGHG
jgi:predicted enzyme related to lactoylglutathione lyase